MKEYKVILMVPVSAEVEAHCHQHAAEAAIAELQSRHNNFHMAPLVLSTEELKTGVDNDLAS